MEKLEKTMFSMMEQRLKTRISNGELTEDPQATLTCRKCGTKGSVEPATHWGEKLEGYYMIVDHSCKLENEVSTDVKEFAQYVVLIRGQNAFITEKEKNAYIQAMQINRSTGVNIRKYFIDDLYPIIPFDEWRLTEERRGNSPPEYIAI